jgi:hypothetical protein
VNLSVDVDALTPDRQFGRQHHSMRTIPDWEQHIRSHPLFHTPKWASLRAGMNRPGKQTTMMRPRSEQHLSSPRAGTPALQDWRLEEDMYQSEREELRYKLDELETAFLTISEQQEEEEVEEEEEEEEQVSSLDASQQIKHTQWDLKVAGVIEHNITAAHITKEDRIEPESHSAPLLTLGDTASAADVAHDETASSTVQTSFDANTLGACATDEVDLLLHIRARAEAVENAVDDTDDDVNDADNDVDNGLGAAAAATADFNSTTTIYKSDYVVYPSRDLTQSEEEEGEMRRYAGLSGSVKESDGGGGSVVDVISRKTENRTSASIRQNRAVNTGDAHHTTSTPDLNMAPLVKQGRRSASVANVSQRYFTLLTLTYAFSLAHPSHLRHTHITIACSDTASLYAKSSPQESSSPNAIDSKIFKTLCRQRVGQS